MGVCAFARRGGRADALAGLTHPQPLPQAGGGL